MKLLLDSNIWLRYVIGDDAASLAACIRLFEAIETGKISPYTSTIILLEVYWVLISLYKIPQKEVQRDVERIQQTRGLVIIEKTDFRRAFLLHTHTGVKLADCLIATQLPKGTMLCSFDREFKKIPGLAVAEPAGILQK